MATLGESETGAAAGVGARVTPAMRARAAVPDFLVPGVVRLRLAHKRRDGNALSIARSEMEFLLGCARPNDVERAASAYLERELLRSELRYHPRIIGQQNVFNLEALTRARDRGRGVVLSFLHHGHYEGALSSVARAGETMTLLVSDEMLVDTAPTFLRQHIRVARSHGNRSLSASAGMSACKDALGRGEILAVATDVPGRTPVMFLGAPRLGSSGAVRMALACNSPVVMLWSHCDADGTLSVELSEPFDPVDFPEPTSFLNCLLEHHEEAVLAWPEGYHQPRLRWGFPRP